MMDMFQYVFKDIELKAISKVLIKKVLKKVLCKKGKCKLLLKKIIKIGCMIGLSLVKSIGFSI